MKAVLQSLLLLFTILVQSQTEITIKIDSLNNAGSRLYKKNKIITAFHQFNLTKRLSDSINYNKGKTISNFNLGNIYALMRERASAEESYTAMLNAALANQDDYLIAKAYLNLAIIKKRDEATETVIKLFNKAIFHINKNYFLQASWHNSKGSNNLIVKTYINFANFYLENNDLENARVKILKVEDILANNSKNNINQVASFHNTYGAYFFKGKLYNLAAQKFNKALSYFNVEDCLEHTNCLFLSRIHEKLSLSYSALGSKDMAYKNLLKYYRHKEAYLNKEKVKQIIIEKSRFSVENYKNKVLLANNEKLYQEQIAQKIKSINFVIVWALLLLIVCLVVLFRSYTSKRQLTNVLKTQNKKLELAKNEALKSSEMKSNFISNVSHELRTPLYGVVGLTSIMLENNSLEDRDAKYLKSLKYSGDYLLNLINDILQVGKIESENQELNITPVCLKKLIENVTDSFDYSLEESNNKIHIVIDKEVPDSILCDKLRLTQVLFNLLGNSIKFTQNGNIYVKVIFQKLEGSCVFLRFEVNDNGYGIAKEKQISIFENFTQLSENANTNYQGAGLGLSIASQIVNLFGSKIELESQVGQGSTFAFNVRFNVHAQAVSQISQVKSENTSLLEASTDINILVAEDNKINQIVTSNLLKKQNISFTLVENGQEALNAFKGDNFYDLILMDINMPIMNGYEAAFRIKAIDKNIPIVALTASNPDELTASKFDVKFDDIIIKPFDNDLFFCKINRLVRKAEIV